MTFKLPPNLDRSVIDPMNGYIYEETRDSNSNRSSSYDDPDGRLGADFCEQYFDDVSICCEANLRSKADGSYPHLFNLDGEPVNDGPGVNTRKLYINGLNTCNDESGLSLVLEITDRNTTECISKQFFKSPNRQLSPFEISVFRTVYCENQDCRLVACWKFHQSDGSLWIRRNPFIYDYAYQPCTLVQRNGLRGDSKCGSLGAFSCSRGINCDYSHSLLEQLYHPSVYKTRICKGHQYCIGAFCPFLHNNESYSDEILNLWNKHHMTTRIMHITKSNWNEFNEADSGASSTLDSVSNSNIVQNEYGNNWMFGNVDESRPRNSSIIPMNGGVGVYNNDSLYKPIVTPNIPGFLINNELLSTVVDNQIRRFEPDYMSDGGISPIYSPCSKYDFGINTKFNNEAFVSESSDNTKNLNISEAKNSSIDMSGSYVVSITGKKTPIDEINFDDPEPSSYYSGLELTLKVSLCISRSLFNDHRKVLSVFELGIFRTTRCPLRTGCLSSKVPTRCWATHTGSDSVRWLRRNPFAYEYKHLLCPTVRLNKEHDRKSSWVQCTGGINCKFAHSIEEQMYHPIVYKTTMCTNDSCDRPFCPFLHSNDQIDKATGPATIYTARWSGNKTRRTYNIPKKK